MQGECIDSPNSGRSCRRYKMLTPSKGCSLVQEFRTPAAANRSRPKRLGRDPSRYPAETVLCSRDVDDEGASILRELR